MRAKFVGGTLNGQEMPLPQGRRYIVATARWPEKGVRVEMRETYRRDGHNGKFSGHPEDPQPHLVFTYSLESVEDWKL